jgi:GNAT superfamily N-acetyltransferase
MATFLPAEFTYHPLTLARWDDFQTLFTEPGIQNGCWCMYWRLRRADCQHGYGEGNKQAFKTLLEGGNVPGILAYHQGQPVGWCAIAPREETAVLDRSPMLKRVDDLPVWSITCFFISKPYRRQRMTELLIHAALDYARQQGAQIVEAYPLRTEITKLLPYERYMGIQSTFERLGFKITLQRSDRRPVMRYYFADPPDPA